MADCCNLQEQSRLLVGASLLAMLLAYKDRQQAGSYFIYTQCTQPWPRALPVQYTLYGALSVPLAAPGKVKRPFIDKNSSL
jgi:hypothetical protein